MRTSILAIGMNTKEIDMKTLLCCVMLLVVGCSTAPEAKSSDVHVCGVSAVVCTTDDGQWTGCCNKGDTCEGVCPVGECCQVGINGSVFDSPPDNVVHRHQWHP
jgi:hypothetical protein